MIDVERETLAREYPSPAGAVHNRPIPLGYLQTRPRRLKFSSSKIKCGLQLSLVQYRPSKYRSVRFRGPPPIPQQTDRLPLSEWISPRPRHRNLPSPVRPATTQNPRQKALPFPSLTSPHRLSCLLACLVARNMLLSLLLPAAVLLVFLLTRPRRKIPKGLRRVPGPKGLPLIGNTLQVPASRPEKKFLEWAREFGEIYRVQIGWNEWVFVNSDIAVKVHLLSRSHTLAFWGLSSLWSVGYGADGRKFSISRAR